MKRRGEQHGQLRKRTLINRGTKCISKTEVEVNWHVEHQTTYKALQVITTLKIRIIVGPMALADFWVSSTPQALKPQALQRLRISVISAASKLSASSFFMQENQSTGDRWLIFEKQSDDSVIQ